jgi:hypothetical protein
MLSPSLYFSAGGTSYALYDSHLSRGAWGLEGRLLYAGSPGAVEFGHTDYIWHEGVRDEAEVELFHIITYSSEEKKYQSKEQIKKDYIVSSAGKVLKSSEFP